MLKQGIDKILPGTGRGTAPSAVEGARLFAASTMAPLHHFASLDGPPPRNGEDQA